MKGFQGKMLAGAMMVAGLMASGCHSDGEWHWHDDPCWPDRYANEARASVVASFQPQVENGQILDQTIWNKHFEYGSDKLNGDGMDKLDQLARRRPQPDPRLFLQTARDIPYDADKGGEYAAKRVELDSRRVVAIQKYLKATLTGREMAFEVQIHDPVYPGIDVNPGVAPRVYVPSPQERSRGANVPPLPVTGIGGKAAAGGGAARRSREGEARQLLRLRRPAMEEAPARAGNVTTGVSSSKFQVSSCKADRLQLETRNLEVETWNLELR